MLQKEQLKGMWVSVVNPWQADGSLNEGALREEIRMLIAAGAHGLYTTGSTGEFYALDWDEWAQITDIFLSETVGKIPMQVGANWFNTRDTIKRVRYARDHGAEAVQVCFPGWMEMRQEDYDQFLVDVYEAVPDISIIHYNILRTKKRFNGKDYARVLPRVPTMIGSKAGMPLNDFMELALHAPGMHHFVGEHVFPLGHQLGAPGMYTSWFMMNPPFFHHYYQLCLDGQYKEAIALSLRMGEWLDRAVMPLIAKGYMDPALDKAFVEMAGWLPCSRHTRKPHQPITDAEMTELRHATAETMPEFLSYRP